MQLGISVVELRRLAGKASWATADGLYLYDGGLTPKLAKVIKQIFREMHLLNPSWHFLCLPDADLARFSRLTHEI